MSFKKASKTMNQWTLQLLTNIFLLGTLWYSLRPYDFQHSYQGAFLVVEENNVAGSAHADNLSKVNDNVDDVIKSLESFANIYLKVCE